MTGISQFQFLVDTKWEYANWDLPYTFVFGGNSRQTMLTEWCNRVDEIRKQLEAYIIEGETRVELYNEDVPHSFYMKKLPSAKTSENHMILHINPDYDEKGERKGEYHERQVIGAIYSGLLFGMTARKVVDWCERWWDCKMGAYNSMKSYLIEAFLSGNDAYPDYRNVIKHILVYNGTDFIHLCDESDGYHVPVDDLFIVRGKDGSILCQLAGVKTNLQKDKKSALQHMIEQLPSDFDLWDISDQGEGMIAPVQYIKRNITDTGCHFEEENYSFFKYRNDAYGFTSKDLQCACDERDMESIKHFVELGAELSRAIIWVLGTHDVIPDPRRAHEDPEPTDEELLAWDKEKVSIVAYLLDNGADPTGNRYHSNENLTSCIRLNCPECLELLLKRGADPNVVGDDGLATRVKFRSVLNYAECVLREGVHPSITLRMKEILETYGARDFVLYNDDSQSQIDEHTF